MYNLVEKFKKNAQKNFEKNNSKLSIENCKQGKYKLITLQFQKFFKSIIFFLS